MMIMIIMIMFVMVSIPIIIIIVMSIVITLIMSIASIKAKLKHTVATLAHGYERLHVMDRGVVMPRPESRIDAKTREIARDPAAWAANFQAQQVRLRAVTDARRVVAILEGGGDTPGLHAAIAVHLRATRDWREHLPPDHSLHLP